MPQAVLDIGSNTIRLLVGDVVDGMVQPLLDKSEFVRLGRGVDGTGELSADRITAGVEAIGALAALARETGARGLTAVATSAVRDAVNGTHFVRQVRTHTGVEVRIISGDEEAALTFRGATAGLDLEGESMVVDLGGGSAEIIAASGPTISWERSLPLGSGRLSERFLSGDPPAAACVQALRDYVVETLSTLPQAAPSLAIFTGGTATHVALVAGKRARFVEIEPKTLEEVAVTIASLSFGDIVERYAIRRERAEVLAAGAAALTAIAQVYAVKKVAITRQGMREGVLLAGGA